MNQLCTIHSFKFDKSDIDKFRCHLSLQINICSCDCCDVVHRTFSSLCLSETSHATIGKTPWLMMLPYAILCLPNGFLILLHSDDRLQLLIFPFCCEKDIVIIVDSKLKVYKKSVTFFPHLCYFNASRLERSI